MMGSRVVKRVVGFGTVVAVFASLYVFGIMPRIERTKARNRLQRTLNAPRRVIAVTVTKGPSVVDLSLPGTAQPLQYVMLLARANGYLKKYAYDIGTHVKQGALLAVIEAPELNQEIENTRARLKEAEQNIGLAQTAAERLTRLAAVQAASQQDAENAQARANTGVAAVNQNRAELERLMAIRSYQRVVAPFDGVITKRSVEVGDLVNAGTTPLFEISQLKTLRVFVDVPQELASSITPGMDAVVLSRDARNRSALGKVVRTAGALDISSHLLRTEVHIPGEGSIAAGAFVYVNFKLKRMSPPVIIPARALMIRKEGPTVIVVNNDHTIARRIIQLGRDLGKELEVVGGLNDYEKVIINPPDGLRDGEKVVPTS